MGDYKQVKMFHHNHAKLEEARQLDRKQRYQSWEKSYNDMIGFLCDFYLEFNEDGGRVRESALGAYRKPGQRRCAITYPPPIQGPSRDEMGVPLGHHQ